METRTVEQVKSWKTRSFGDGYAGLRELSNGEFSGAVRAGGAWLFMLNGRIIGVYEGSLDDFEDADGTAYAAPHPSLPLLFSMQEQGGETQAKYYTNDTPLSEVDSTLTSGNFTGYVELSENVLSGDYYVAYYGGRSMSVAFVGASEQVVTGDDAFERANDEVGIYEVRDVDVEVIDLPEPDEPEEPEPSGVASGPDDARGAGSSEPSGGAGAAGAGANSATGAGEPSGGVGRAPGGDSTRSDADTASADAAPTDAGRRPERDASGQAAGQRSLGQQSAEQQSAAGRVEEAEPTSDTEQSPTGGADTSDAGVGATGTEVETTEREVEPAEADARATGAGEQADAGASEQAGVSADTATPGGEAAARAEPSAGAEPSADPARTDSTPESESDGEPDERETGGAFADEEEWRETTTIPSLDPDRSEDLAGAAAESAESAADDGGASPDPTSPESATGGSPSDERPSADRASRGRSDRRSRSSAASGQNGSPSAPETETATGGASEAGGADGAGSPGAGASGQSSEVSEDAKERVQQLRSQLKQRKQQVKQLKDRLSDVESERNEYKRERDALRQEVERLEAKLETAGSAGSASGKRQLDPSQAFDGTNLFVRYESKGKATLDEAAEGTVEAEDVNANLRLEHHTQFEADDVEVAGEAFDSFLTDSFEYRFVSWVVEELLYEIRDTGHRTSLKDLYESIPKIDRVDLHGSVSAGSTDDDTRQESFDIIMRDRMGNPLLVADLNDSRDPTTGEMMGSLVDASSDVAQTHDELSGTFQVTESFFEPEALETTESATSGGFLSREKRESFVKLSRKRGYHLCLVESRSGGFHLNVPEL
ncbi:hypothetical protein M0R89_14960 [Halorussus limi]|uniref:DUF7527 domain-containing protein n=1 Tax=Halorussus limi TaxID=2938695 RepID=A0A8U0HRV5_9EURY|nr:hypothetical protein [Halorussus limi]UPV73832.1 hypothetical protein M0R89_14960 [Halorussus limi]